jgi:hypothetical protein
MGIMRWYLCLTCLVSLSCFSLGRRPDAAVRQLHERMGRETGVEPVVVSLPKGLKRTIGLSPLSTVGPSRERSDQPFINLAHPLAPVSTTMAFQYHPAMSTYPGASFHSFFNGPHLLTHGGMSHGYWGAAPLDFPTEPPVFEPPPAVQAMLEGRGTGLYGGVGGPPYNYGWPKWGPVRAVVIVAFWSDSAVDAPQT